MVSFLMFIAEAISAPSQGEFREFAMSHDGDARAGQVLFNDARRGCVKCHSTDGHGGKAGPDLFATGDKFPRRELIEAVLNPSASIAVGYETTIIVTKSGDEFVGVIKDATRDSIELIQGSGERIRIATNDIQSRRGSKVSLMPEGLEAGLTTEEFADLIGFLTTLRQPENSLASNRGMPEEIPALTKPIAWTPFLRERIQDPPGFAPSGYQVQNGLLWFGQIPGSRDVFLAAHEMGKIFRIDKSGTNEVKSLFLDLSKEVFNERGPNGLVCMAFHPRFRENRKYYVEHQVFEHGKIETVVAERRAGADFISDSGEPSRRVWQTEAVTEVHTGGCMAFGPDGYLYISMGDTGPQGDPEGHAQNLTLQLGKILRIDLDRADLGLNYAIPRDNPFYGRTNARPEIWAYGLREPWRFSFDPVTKDLWVGDVGQDRVEEVDIVRRGENYGWNVYEGFEPFSNRYRRDGEKFVPPVFAYRRKFGNCVIGGCVYRGDRHSPFYGVYIFEDYSSRRVFGLTQKNRALKTIQEIGTAPEFIAGFTTDERGEIYGIGYGGMVYHLDLAGADFR